MPHSGTEGATLNLQSLGVPGIRKGFLRIPIVPHWLALYAGKLAKFLGNENL
jgi:hypothetical protein